MSSTALKSNSEYATVLEALTFNKGINSQLIASNEEFKKLSSRLLTKLDLNEKPISGKSIFALVGLVALLHAVGLSGFINALNEPSIVKKQKKEVLIEFIKPIVEPPKVIEPPKPPPPPPKLKHAEPPPQSPLKPAVIKTAPAEENIAPSDITIKENTEAVKTSGPAVAEPAKLEPPPQEVKEEPITEARGGVGHLNNPAPEYPEFAQRQGYEGTVVLKVRVLPSGAPSEVKVKKSSGKAILDEAAIEAAKGWAFTPAKKGNNSIEGWAIVPVVFKLE